MALTQRLEIRQGQALVMTPLLQQSIKLLQLSSLELAAFVQAELEKNPLLEPDNAGEDEAVAAGPQDGTSESAAEDTAEQNEWDESSSPDEPRDDSPDAPPFTPSHSGFSTTGSGELDIEILPDQKSSLRAHLEAQLALAALPPHRRFIAEVLIDSVDEAGYLRADLPETAGRLGVSTAECESVLGLLQEFDPCGVFARDLAECLALQLKERQRFDPAMQAMLTRLDLVAKRDCAALCVLCGLDAADIVEMIAEIRALDPKPGLAFGVDHVEAIVADILVRGSASGWQIELNPDALPRVLVNSVYYAEVSRKALARHEKIFLTECLNTANWLTRSLDQRARTILKVAREIVRRQDAFLAYGVRHLRPLNLKAVADAIGMHESTVSRVTSNKYVDTPRGTFELKFFFTSTIQAVDGGDAHSAAAVKDRIRELVANEQNDVLSDDRIVTILGGEGIEIARRTVAKYRDELRIRSSVARRRLRQSQIFVPAVQSG